MDGVMEPEVKEEEATMPAEMPATESTEATEEQTPAPTEEAAA